MIGTGLFYSSSEAINQGGPAVPLAYMIGGAAVYLVLRALGEMAMSNPVSGSFGEYAPIHLGRQARPERVSESREIPAPWKTNNPPYRRNHPYTTLENT